VASTNQPAIAIEDCGTYRNSTFREALAGFSDCNREHGWIIREHWVIVPFTSRHPSINWDCTDFWD
jgi:hypothetical protein